MHEYSSYANAEPMNCPGIRSYTLAAIFGTIIGLIGLIPIFVLQNIVWALVAISGYTLLLIASTNDRQFTSAIAIFALFYYPYSTWYAFQLLIGDFAYNSDHLLESLRLAYIGLLAFVAAGALTGVIMRMTPKRLRQRCYINAEKPRQALDFIIWLCMGLIFVGIIDALLSGASSKRELVDANLSLQRVAGTAAVLLTAAVIVSFLSARHDAVNASWRALINWRVLIPFLLMLLEMVTTGERDYVFRFGFCILAVYFVTRKRAGVAFMLCVLLGLVLVLPVTQAAKALLLPGSNPTLTYGVDALFNGEFLSASRNTYMLVFHHAPHGYDFVKSDLIRGLLPFAGDLGFESSSAWYNHVFRVENGFGGASGWGFGLVPQGYLVGGRMGVVWIVGIVSVLLHMFYFVRYRSDMWMTFYLLALSSIVYCIRADLANVLAQAIRLPILCVLVLCLSCMAFNAVSRVEKRQVSPGG